MTSFTITNKSGVQIRVITILKVVCALAICLEITSTSGPFGEIIWIKAAKGLINQINRKHPLTLKIQCAAAVLLAFLGCPMLASTAVIVVPILSPSRIGIAPVRPITLLTPSAPG